ncbi:MULTISPECIES: hypothetical protein [unclassified Streptomyces]|uniref:hypothetical protein n=1 Tax=unclassified Streptomyces TaxID=2593676 RepID=UPI001F046FEB|nr:MULTISPECIES: hypothetical protein [unclassified Streptomyces]MCH0562264.1 hypothetical protein [Streptomyces sp. MUM 2J]MCH0573220.1 hypothetical protein [Streptomyces sp. MUM 136J]
MTPRDTGVQGTPIPAVRVRAAEGDVDDASLERIRDKVLAALNRPGLPPLGGEVRIARATARHTEQPWSARGEIRVGADLVVVHAQETSAYRLAERLHDRLRGQVERVVHRGETARRTSAPPPWRGGPGDARAAEVSPGS